MKHLVLTDDADSQIVGCHLQLNDYLAPLVAAQTGELWMQFENQPDISPIKIADVVPGQTVQIPFTSDDTVIFYLLSHDPSAGKKTVFDLKDARCLVIAKNRELQIPIIFSDGAATNTQQKIGITNYSSLARFRKIQIAADVNFTTPVETAQGIENSVFGLPATIIQSRSTNLTSAETFFVRVAHSSNDIEFGEWSEPLQFTYPDNTGAGGSGGGTPPGEGYLAATLSGEFNGTSEINLEWTDDTNGSGTWRLEVKLTVGSAWGTIDDEIASAERSYDIAQTAGAVDRTVYYRLRRNNQSLYSNLHAVDIPSV